MINVRSSSLLIFTIAAVSANSFTSRQQSVPAIDGDPAPVVVTIICDAQGYSSNEAEMMVASPLEAALNGMSNVQRLRSASRNGRAVVWVEFDRDIDFHRARQMVTERTMKAALPDDVALILAPASSGEIILITFCYSTVADSPSKQNERAVQLRHFAEMTLRQRLLLLTGISEVTVVGGLRKQYEVIPSAEKLAAFDVTAGELARALQEPNIPAGDFDLPGRTERKVIVRRADPRRMVDDISDTVVKVGPDGAPLFVKDMAHVRIGLVSDLAEEAEQTDRRENTDKRSEVVLAVQVQPGVKLLEASEKIDEVLKQSRKKLPKDVKPQRKVDPQQDRIVRTMMIKLRRNMPPNVQLQRRSSEQLGDVLAVISRERVVVKLFGPDLSILRATAEEIRTRVKEIPGVDVPRLNSSIDERELQIEIDRDAATRFGVTRIQVAEAIKMANSDFKVSTIQQEDETYDLVFKNTPSGKAPEWITNTKIRTKTGELVTVGHIARVTQTSVASDIYHENGQRVISIFCHLNDRKPADVKSDIRKSLTVLRMSLDDRYSIVVE